MERWKNDKMKTKNPLGDSPRIKVLYFLMRNKEKSFSLVEIRDKAKVGYSTLKQLMPKILKEKLVLIDRIICKSNLYKINMEHNLIQTLEEKL